MFTRRIPGSACYLEQLQLQSPPLAKAGALRNAADLSADQVKDFDFAEFAGFFVTCGALGAFFMRLSQEKKRSDHFIQVFERRFSVAPLTSAESRG
jgi:hypothetical protein